ncbi:hypothetical protein PoB_000244300 [Plakobranchus ocellatus]|uniref:Uncharacterized protein n=1 Tax=Plakobranchus ocellatus TaxID=259542 RepID=A0AAV3Y104_9GAST|nr:hypothetical protein PoB_000244300 [Plakobranchus ocellatus]
MAVWRTEMEVSHSENVILLSLKAKLSTFARLVASIGGEVNIEATVDVLGKEQSDSAGAKSHKSEREKEKERERPVCKLAGRIVLYELQMDSQRRVASSEPGIDNN